MLGRRCLTASIRVHSIGWHWFRCCSAVPQRLDIGGRVWRFNQPKWWALVNWKIKQTFEYQTDNKQQQTNTHHHHRLLACWPSWQRAQECLRNWPPLFHGMKSVIKPLYFKWRKRADNGYLRFCYIENGWFWSPGSLVHWGQQPLPKSFFTWMVLIISHQHLYERLQYRLKRFFSIFIELFLTNHPGVNKWKL